MSVAVSVINMKGGVGKTTLAFNLAWYAAHEKNYRVLVVDLDPQSNASQYLMGAKEYLSYIRANKPTVVDILEQFSPVQKASGSEIAKNPHSATVHVKSWVDNSKIDLIPSRLELAWTLKNPTSKDHLLERHLSSIRDDYDLILVDCAPTESILSQSAYKASDHVLIPVKPEFLAAIGLPLLARSLREYHQSFGKSLQIAGIVFNDSDPQFVKPEHKAGRRDVKALATQESWYVFENEVRHSDSYPRGARDASPIFLTDFARSWVKDEFQNFGDEFLGRVGL